METVVWATYSALDQKAFDIRQTFARPFVAVANAAALSHASQVAATVATIGPANAATTATINTTATTSPQE